MEKLMQKLKTYEAWVAKNPDLISDWETASKWASFAVGRASNSYLMSELAYAASNLMIFYHDRIITRSHDAQSTSKQEVNGETIACIKNLLTTLDHCEVFFELLFRRLGGKRGKWMSVTIIQLVKLAGRCYLVLNVKNNIVANPPIPFLSKRNRVVQTAEVEVKPGTSFLDGNSFQFQLKRSGRIMRKVEGAPPLQYRDLESYQTITTNNKSTMNDTESNLLFGELVYIAKPIVHLVAMYLAGSSKKTQPYYLALSMDMLSLVTIYQNREKLSKSQRLEMSRRCLRMFMYFMRSPIYELSTQRRLTGVLDSLSNIPLMRLLTDGMKDYLPIWQETYFYLWSV